MWMSFWPWATAAAVTYQVAQRIMQSTPIGAERRPAEMEEATAKRATFNAAAQPSKVAYGYGPTSEKVRKVKEETTYYDRTTDFHTDLPQARKDELIAAQTAQQQAVQQYEAPAPPSIEGVWFEKTF